MKQIYDILTLTDDNYAPYCGIMLTSVFENNTECSFRVYILVRRELSKRNIAGFHKLENRYGCVISFIVVDDSFLKRFDLNNNTRVPVETFYKLYAADLLPETAGKVLYLDCDIVVTGDITCLWALDLADKAIAVVPDVLNYVEPEEYPGRLGYPLEAGTFNGGVIMMNLDYWRRFDIAEKLFRFLENNHDYLRYFDQDVLNAVLWDKKLFLPVTYNFQFNYLWDGIFQSLPAEVKKELRDTIQSQPVIIHFADYLKPWSVTYYGLPYRKLWLYYKKKSPWLHIGEIVPKNKSINWLIKRYLMWPTGIMKNNRGLLRCD